jgi:predicted ATPase
MGGLVMLVGEPGIGKTRTAQELMGFAGRMGAHVLWGRCYEGEGAPPYWPWVQILRASLEDADQERIWVDMGQAAADMATMLPELRNKWPDLDTPPVLDPEQARFRLFDSVTTFFRNVSGKQPLLLVLDDLHWADRSSLLLLEFLAEGLQGMPVLIVGTYRDIEIFRGHPLSETLGNLIRYQGFQRINMLGLSQQEVGEFLEATGRVRPSASVVAAIHGRTEGNPLFLSEVSRILPRDNSSIEPTYLSSIPEGVRETIGRRLSRLSPDCIQVLTTAAVIGREFELRLLSTLVDDLSEDRLLEVLEEALLARVTEELPQALGRYQFSHALIQETLLGELTLTRRVRLHARIAQRMEEIYQRDIKPHAAELAYHFSQASPILGAQKQVAYSGILLL